MESKESKEARIAFMGEINQLIKKLEKKCRNDEERGYVDRMRTRMQTITSTVGTLEIPRLCSEYLIEKRDLIINRDENFFMSKRVLEGHKEEKLAESLVISMQSIYRESTQSEKDAIYEDAMRLLRSAISYQMTLPDDD